MLTLQPFTVVGFCIWSTRIQRSVIPSDNGRHVTWHASAEAVCTSGMADNIATMATSGTSPTSVVGARRSGLEMRNPRLQTRSSPRCCSAVDSLSSRGSDGSKNVESRSVISRWMSTSRPAVSSRTAPGRFHQRVSWLTNQAVSHPSALPMHGMCGWYRVRRVAALLSLRVHRCGKAARPFPATPASETTRHVARKLRVYSCR